MVNQLIEYNCKSPRFKARVLHVNVLRTAGNVESDHILAVDNVRI